MSDSYPGESVTSSCCDLFKHRGRGKKGAQVQLVWLGVGLFSAWGTCAGPSGRFQQTLSSMNLNISSGQTSLIVEQLRCAAPGEWLRVR